MKSYQKLLERSKEVSLISATSALLQWDQEILLPKRGVDFRADQLAWLGGKAHRLWTEDAVGEWIEAATDEVDAGSLDAVNVERCKYDYERARKIPVALVEKSARVEAQGHESWKEARAKSDFSRFAESLTELVELSKQKAELWGYTNVPYDALLEGYEPGLTASQVQDLFGPLASQLAEICETAYSKVKDVHLPAGEYPVDQQKQFNAKVVEAVGFDLDRGRIDISVHPFSSGMGPHDNRITTRYDARDFTSSFSGILHEAGHGMYEQGLRPEAHGTPCGSSVSLGIHESQSRFWENQIGRSHAFWEYWYPVAVEHFPQLQQISIEDLVAYVNHVKRSFIRVDASEIGYDLHVILRFEVEEKIFSGELAVSDIPGYWNERFKQLIGLEVQDDAQGCLQDIHWSMGGFGYFPTYTLGSINAAQIYAAVEKTLGNVDQLLAAGRYSEILMFLRENIHQHGRRYLPNELMQLATGSEPATDAFLSYFREKVERI
ncbi:MAG: carboxypeptidase M32 [Verrucomicrobiota bacterium]